MRAPVVGLLPATSSPDYPGAGGGWSLAAVTMPSIVLLTFKCRFVPRPTHTTPPFIIEHLKYLNQLKKSVVCGASWALWWSVYLK